jgi:hypothetical protein
MRHSLFQVGIVLALLALVAGLALADGTLSVPLAAIAQLTPPAEAPWFCCPQLSWGGAIHQNSFRTPWMEGGGLWDLGLFTKVGPGYQNPKYFSATFGVSADSSEDAAFQITIFGNPADHPKLMSFVVDQNHAHVISVALEGAWRLQVRYERLKGLGAAVMIEPSLMF